MIPVVKGPACRVRAGVALIEGLKYRSRTDGVQQSIAPRSDQARV